MPEVHPTLDRAQFGEWVQDALNRLYDSPYLQTHPLATALAIEHSRTLQPSQMVRKRLMDAIESLRPGTGVPAQSPDWRAYHILELRYIEGLPPIETMNRLGLARSHYFREQGRALEALIALLWRSVHGDGANDTRQTDVGDNDQRDELAQTEVDRLRTQGNRERLDASAFVTELGPVFERLASARQTTLQVELPADAIMIYADRVLLRQALLMAASLALDHAGGQPVRLGIVRDETVCGLILFAHSDGNATALDRFEERIEMCTKLMAAMDGRLQASVDRQNGLALQLLWPTLAPGVVLVIDDNQAVAELFRRYLAAYGWQVRGAANAAEARLVLAEDCPSLIILDVMMPHEDGWEFLLSLKQDARTRTIPTVICSVLQDPQIALSLGADAYLAKPVSQQALLDLLATT